MKIQAFKENLLKGTTHNRIYSVVGKDRAFGCMPISRNFVQTDGDDMVYILE